MRDQLRIAIKPRWWLQYYVLAEVYVSKATGLEINQRRFAYWCAKGLYSEFQVNGQNPKKLNKINNIKR